MLEFVYLDCVADDFGQVDQKGSMPFSVEMDDQRGKW